VDTGPLTITDAAARIRRGELTPSDLLEVCLARIDRYEDAVRAWAYLDRERARRDAERLTDELKRGQDRGPLHGIPVGVKDIIDVFDMPTGCGSKLWANSYARKDATCVERLRQAGAVILGKTVTTAYAYLDPPVTRNPWNLDRTPGGSSSGSAAAVACGMCLAALGSQTGGSVIRPASFCGVYGLKPSHSRVSTDGVLPLAPSLDHVGVMARSIRDLATVLQPIAERGAVHVPEPYDYPAEIDNPDGYRLHQLGTVASYPADRLDPAMASAFEGFRDRTQRAKWAWYSLPLPPSFGQVLRSNAAIYSVQAARYHADRLRRRPDDYPPRVRGLVEDGLRVTATEFDEATAHHTAFQDEIEATFVDSWQILAVPAAAGPAPDATTTGDPSFQSPWSYAGLPTVTVPIGRSPDGLPLGVQLVGRRWCEDDVFRVAVLLEADLELTPTLPPIP
jgi:aspartyl-tRNA(Asn)/glutamyl-tRNA(Gln) amidotransferase subunit A